MPGPKPVEIERWVRDNYPETETLILTAHDRDAFRSTRLTASLAEMEEAGAAGFLTKDEEAPALAGNRGLHAIRRAARGEVLYTQKQLERARRWRVVVKID
jgi:DNA-binding NarL/FixJ family response regulator